MLGALLSFVGGRIANRQKQKAQARADWMNSPQGIRENYEAAGFNPLLAFQAPGVGTGAGAPLGLGDGLAQSFAAAGSLVDSRQAALEVEKARLETENQRLEKIANDHILTPDVPGIYGGRNASAQGDRASLSHAADRQLFGGTAHVAPGREIEVAPYTVGSGVTEINNRFTGPIAVPGADGEPWGIDEAATAIVFGAPQMALNAGKALQQELVQRNAEKAWRKYQSRKPKPKKQTKEKRGDRRSRRQN